MITHIVLFKFENAERAQEAVAQLLSMKGRVSSLAEVHAGLDFTRSPRSYELGLITRHHSRDDLEAYAVDPYHMQVAQFIGQHASGSVAVDFQSDS